MRPQITRDFWNCGFRVCGHQVLIVVQERGFGGAQMGVFGSQSFGVLGCHRVAGLPVVQFLEALEADPVVGQQSAFVAQDGLVLENHGRPDVDGWLFFVGTTIGIHLINQGLHVQFQVLQSVLHRNIVVGGQGTTTRVGAGGAHAVRSFQFQQQIADVVTVIHRCLSRVVERWWWGWRICCAVLLLSGTRNQANNGGGDRLMID